MEEKFREVLNSVNAEILENEDADLLEEGILDSLMIMMLVTNLESAFSIYIDPDDIEEENFSTVEDIRNLVKKYKNV